MNKNVDHPTMATNKMKLECSFFFFGQCQLSGGGLPEEYNNFQKKRMVKDDKDCNNPNNRR